MYEKAIHHVVRIHHWGHAVDLSKFLGPGAHIAPWVIGTGRPFHVGVVLEYDDGTATTIEQGPYVPSEVLSAVFPAIAKWLAATRRSVAIKDFGSVQQALTAIEAAVRGALGPAADLPENIFYEVAESQNTAAEGAAILKAAQCLKSIGDEGGIDYAETSHASIEIGPEQDLVSISVNSNGTIGAIMAIAGTEFPTLTSQSSPGAFAPGLKSGASVLPKSTISAIQSKW